MTDKKVELNLELPTCDNTSESGSRLHAKEDESMNGYTKQNGVTKGFSNGDRIKSPQAKQKSFFERDGAESRYKSWLRCESVGLAAVIFIIWGLFALPILFYHLPMESTSSENVTTVGERCLSVVRYEGVVCKEELQSLSNCIPPNSAGDGFLIQSDQSDAVRDLLSGLNLFASEECKAAARPFLCVHFFGLCDSTGRAYKPSSSQCTEISTGVCSQEWALAGNLPGVTLPDCASFPDETILNAESCENMESSGLSSTNDLLEGTLSTLPPTMSKNQTCMCRESFFCRNGSNVCFPRCGSWEEYSRTSTAIIDAVVILAASIGFVSGVAVLVIAGVRRKKVFVFPSVLVVYQTITTLVLATVVLVNYMDRATLYCSSENLLEAVMTATPFCVLSGIVFHYVLLQLALWWIFHIAALFWKIRFPFHARRFDSARRVRYVHFTVVALALFVPVIPVIAAMVNYAVEDSNSSVSPAGRLGFGLIRFPPILCVGNDRDVTYYSLIFPLNIIVIAGIALMVLIFWIIHKQHGLFMVKQSKNPFKIGTAERKILIVFCYYVLLVVFALISFTISTRNSDLFASELTKYFLCEQGGLSSSCSREEFERLTQPVLTSIAYSLLGLLPLVNLTFVINVQEVKEKLEQCLPQTAHRHRKSQQPTSTASASDPPSTGTVMSAMKREEE